MLSYAFPGTCRVFQFQSVMGGGGRMEGGGEGRISKHDH